jgi:hypothetical protein
MPGPEDHEALVGLSDRDLRLRAGTATHQHYKGGLYRVVGGVCDADTGEPVMGKDGEPRVLYEHVYPHAPMFWLRDRSEFVGTILDTTRESVARNGTTCPPRFRKLT